MIDESQFDNLPDDPVEAGIKICEMFDQFNKSFGSLSRDESYDDYLTYFAVLQAYIESAGEVSNPPKLTQNRSNNIIKIIDFFDNFLVKLKNKSILEKDKTRYLIKFGASFCYEFTEGDLKRVQIIINELRTMISESKIIEEDHKVRLLKRLEKLQSEVNKRVPDLDRFWGLVGDAGVAVGKFGKDSKPFVDRIRELIGIIWRTQARAEELPSDAQHALINEEEDE
ncbi:MAG: hypothetical protein SVS15_00775 [Thermodesulfobacteriota bacterium]|nr:hypothetical protein [Thermodesulfobacteriota bacterium]